MGDHQSGRTLCFWSSGTPPGSVGSVTEQVRRNAIAVELVWIELMEPIRGRLEVSRTSPIEIGEKLSILVHLVVTELVSHQPGDRVRSLGRVCEQMAHRAAGKASEGVGSERSPDNPVGFGAWPEVNRAVYITKVALQGCQVRRRWAPRFSSSMDDQAEHRSDLAVQDIEHCLELFGGHTVGDHSIEPGLSCGKDSENSNLE